MFFIIYMCICAGISIIISQSEIFDGIRNAIEKKSPFFGNGIKCPLCVGFWVGIFLSIIGISPAHLYIYPYIVGILKDWDFYFMYFLNGPVSAVLSWAIFNLVEFLQKKHLYDYLERQVMED